MYIPIKSEKRKCLNWVNEITYGNVENFKVKILTGFSKRKLFFNLLLTHLPVEDIFL